jgi:hypothetical protein
LEAVDKKFFLLKPWRKFVKFAGASLPVPVVSCGKLVGGIEERYLSRYIMHVHTCTHVPP